MSRARAFLLGLTSVVLSLTMVVLALEAGLRFLPVQFSPRTIGVTHDQPVLRGPAHARFCHSLGPAFADPNCGQYNREGFVSPVDYSEHGPRPLVAVVGDSYIEAFMVPAGETIQGRLAADLGQNGRVYAFAMSGAPLSQYVAWAGAARERYRPDFLIVSVVGNDFDESHASHRLRDGFWHYYPSASGRLELRLTPYDPGFVRRFLLKSALARYLVFHLDARSTIERLKRIFVSADDPPRASFVGNTASDADQTRQQDSFDVVDSFVADLAIAAGLPPERILITVDGFRAADVPMDVLRGSYFGLMRQYLLRKAATAGYETLDLEPIFSADFGRNRRSFSFIGDAHWSAYGHAVVADAVRGTAWYRQLRN